MLTPQPGPDTNAWRVHHDARAGVWVDEFDGRWLIQTQRPEFPRHWAEARPEHVQSIYWKGREKTASAVPEKMWGDSQNDPFTVTENGARFVIDFSAGYSPGIFLDQRENRKRVRDAVAPGERVLNTFAYTGAFSVMAALGGAETTTLDLSARYLDWGWDNFRANNLDPDQHHGVKGDAFEWLRTFARKGRSFHGIVLDPPTFSRGSKKGKKVFKTDEDYAELVSLAAGVVEPGGWILCCANTHRMSAGSFEKEVARGMREANSRDFRLTRHSMPSEFRGDDYLKTVWVDVS